LRLVSDHGSAVCAEYARARFGRRIATGVSLYPGILLTATDAVVLQPF
jgi:hypothetical protein